MVLMGLTSAPLNQRNQLLSERRSREQALRLDVLATKRRRDSLQLAGSSDPSTQSLSLSHTHTRGMQRLVMAHWNWLGAHVTSAAPERDILLSTE